MVGDWENMILGEVSSKSSRLSDIKSTLIGSLIIQEIQSLYC